MRSWRSCTVFLSLCLGLVFGEEAVSTVFFHGGTIRKIERLKIGSSVPAVNLDKALKQGQMLPGKTVPKSFLENKTAEKGLCWLVLTVAVDQDRTIGPLDYVLMSEEKVFPCQGLAEASAGHYDFRNQLFTGPGQVKMLFALPERAASASLKCAYEGLVIPEIKLPLPPPPPLPPLVKTSPAVKKKAVPAVKKQAAPAVKKQTAPAVKKQAVPAVKKQVVPAVKKQAVPAVKKTVKSGKGQEKQKVSVRKKNPVEKKKDKKK